MTNAWHVGLRPRAVLSGLLLALLMLLVSAAQSYASHGCPYGACDPEERGEGQNMDDRRAAEVVDRSEWEPRASNWEPNHRVPTESELRTFYNASGTGSQVPAPHRYRVTGNFTGTTDEILQWAAYKWGIDEDIFRAVAMTESGWNQRHVGDHGSSFGIMQVKAPTGERWSGWEGTHPVSQTSTAFNADVYGAALRHCYDRRRDLWGCVGNWYSGGWYDQGSLNYQGSVKRHRDNRTWEDPEFWRWSS